jgi:hypothetical protein
LLRSPSAIIEKVLLTAVLLGDFKQCKVRSSSLFVSGELGSPFGAWRHAPLPNVPDTTTTVSSPTSPSLKDIMIAEEAQEEKNTKKLQTSR